MNLKPFAIIVAALVSFPAIFAVPLMWLWNRSIVLAFPTIADEIGYLPALGITELCFLLPLGARTFLWMVDKLGDVIC